MREFNKVCQSQIGSSESYCNPIQLAVEALITVIIISVSVIIMFVNIITCLL